MNAFAADATFATGAQAEERYLVPVFVIVPGVHGSFFVSSLSVMPVGAPVDVQGLLPQCPGDLCGPKPLVFRVEPGRTYANFTAVGRPGLLLKAPGGTDLRLGLRVRDTSRDQSTAGTEIPVVHESRMSDRTLFLLSVPPQGERFRKRLRVYAFNPGAVRVSFVRQGDNVLLHQTTLSLTLPMDAPADQSGLFPAYAEFADFPAGVTAMTIEVEPLMSIGKIWAFVTTTNNLTQEITAVTPNP